MGGPQTDTKKLKMSTPALDDGDCALTSSTKFRYKRRKIAIFLAYCGAGYKGMQKNPGAKTIEGDLEESLYLSGAVTDPDRGCPKRFDWARAARTDKGVSAAGQVVSGRFYIDPPCFVRRLNASLPPQIRIFGFQRVTSSFNAKRFCDRRRYVYLIPVFALDPCSHRDRESVVASVGSENELVKCLECSERGRKKIGLTGEYVSKNSVNSDISLNTEATASKHTTNNESSVSENNVGIEVSSDTKAPVFETTKFQKETRASKDDFTQVFSSFSQPAAAFETRLGDKIRVSENTSFKPDLVVFEPTKFIDDEISVSISEFVNEPKLLTRNDSSEESSADRFWYGEKEKERFNRILANYVGTHNFHNFTTRIKAEDPAANRFIISFDASTVVIVDGIEFVKCEVMGQSFMLHQIRKMMGLAVAIMRNFAPESLLQAAFRKDLDLNVPTAPELGLFLDECFFSSYNEKWKDSHEELCMKPYEEEAEEFKVRHIYSHIASTESMEGVVGLWLHSLNSRNYPDLDPQSELSPLKELEVGL